MTLYAFPHSRLNPLTGEWVLVSPHRTQRPWLGQVDAAPVEALPAYDPNCYLCPGNLRAGGKRNPEYTGTYVFDNDYPALLVPEGSGSEQIPIEPVREGVPGHSTRIFAAEPEHGICRVVCFSPRHDLTIPELAGEQVVEVVRTWIDQTADLAGKDFVRYVQIFENKGALMGASNPHPHCQIWATSRLPNEPAKEQGSQADYYIKDKTCLLCEYLKMELQSGQRVVVRNQSFTALVPFWAVWPYEVLLLPNRHIASLPDLDKAEVSGLAEIMQRVTTRYDNLFETSFPYSMGFHQAPFGSGDQPGWHLHAHYYPPLLRSATVRKFMVGFEMLASPQRDLTPEEAAARLKTLPDIHYRRC